MNKQRSQSTPRVLVIEDNPADVRLIEEGVATAGIELDLQVYNSGNRAIEQLEAVDTDAVAMHPNLVLLDLNLPGKSGFDVLAFVRSETVFQDVPVVVVSSSENPDDVARVYDAAANAFVTKPTDPDEFISMIGSAIEFWLTNGTSRPTHE